VRPTHRHTDHATCDICRNRPHAMHTMQPNDDDDDDDDNNNNKME